MIGVRKLFVFVIPSMLVGGLVFRNTFGHAAAGTGDLFGYWPAASDVGSTDAAQRKRIPPAPPVPDRWAQPPTPPTPPTPPRGHRSHGRHGGGRSVSISINGNHIQINGIDDLVAEHLDAVREMLRTNPNIPKDVRDKIVARMDRVKHIVDKRLKNLKTTDIDKLDDAMEKMGEELEQAMAGLDQDLAQLGDKLAKDLAKQVGKDLLKNFTKDKFKLDFNKPDDDDDDDDNNDDNDGDNDDDDAGSVDADSSDPDVGDAIGDLDVMLKPAQKDAIVKLRTDSDARVAGYKKQLDDASKRLEAALGDPRTSDADISRYVDQVSSHEASIRKARLLAWAQARRVLDADQVKKIETAAKKNHR